MTADERRLDDLRDALDGSGIEAAAGEVLARANRTLRGITGIEVLEKKVKIEAGRIAEYRVRVRLVFDMAPEAEVHW